MNMNRRNVLVGLGTIVAGGGAALGTGAFSSVSADRTVNVEVAGDSGSLLALEPDADTELATMDGDTLQINLGDSDAGLNVNATTTVEPLFTATNNGGNTVNFEVSSATGDDVNLSDNTITVGVFEDDNGSEADAGTLDITFYDNSGSADSNSIVNSPVELADADDSDNDVDIAVEIDTNDVSASDISSAVVGIDSITLEANATASGEN